MGVLPRKRPARNRHRRKYAVVYDPPIDSLSQSRVVAWFDEDPKRCRVVRRKDLEVYESVGLVSDSCADTRHGRRD